MNLAGELSGLLTLEGKLILRLLLMTFSHIDTDTAATATLALHRTVIYADGGIDGKGFLETILTVSSNQFLDGFREDVIRYQPDSRCTLNTVERDKVEQLNQRTVAIVATWHIAVAGALVGGEYR